MTKTEICIRAFIFILMTSIAVVALSGAEELNEIIKKAIGACTLLIGGGAVSIPSATFKVIFSCKSNDTNVKKTQSQGDNNTGSQQQGDNNNGTQSQGDNNTGNQQQGQNNISIHAEKGANVDVKIAYPDKSKEIPEPPVIKNSNKE